MVLVNGDTFRGKVHDEKMDLEVFDGSPVPINILPIDSAVREKPKEER